MLINRIHSNYKGFGISSFEEMERLRKTLTPTIFELDQIMINDKLNSQAAAVSAIKNGYYIIGSVSTSGTVSFADSPTIHTNHITARAECKRLAALCPGKLYTFVRLHGAEVVPVTVTTSY